MFLACELERTTRSLQLLTCMRHVGFTLCKGCECGLLRAAAHLADLPIFAVAMLINVSCTLDRLDSMLGAFFAVETRPHGQQRAACCCKVHLLAFPLRKCAPELRPAQRWQLPQRQQPFRQQAASGWQGVRAMSGRQLDDKPTKVLFVCLGNICRSPSAEAVFKHGTHLL